MLFILTHLHHIPPYLRRRNYDNPLRMCNEPGSLAARGWCICEVQAGENVVNYLEPAKLMQMCRDRVARRVKEADIKLDQLDDRFQL